MYNHSIVHRALVTYSNENTGEIIVKIPSVTGVNSTIPISFIGRQPVNNIWIVPAIGDQIVVSADDENFTNVFWLHTDAQVLTQHYRNYFEAIDTTVQENLLVRSPKAITFDTPIYQEGIRLVDNSKIYFDYTGVYNLQFSVQWLNQGTQVKDSVIWINYNGSPYAYSSTYTSIPETHGGVHGTTVTSANIIGETTAGGYIQLMWASDSALVSISTILPADSGINAGEPTSPGIIVTVTQVA